MESGVQSSFIPRDAAQPLKAGRASTGGLSDLLLILAIVGFAASAALAVAVFLYQQYLQSTSASDLAQLQRAQAQFNPALVQQLTRLDDRMQAAQSILAVHMAPSAFFDVLNQVTLQSISFSTLDLDASDPHNMTVKMEGVAQSVNSIALEGDLLSQSGIFTSPIFSNIDRQKDGVHFNLTALVNGAAINFEQLIRANTGAATQQKQPQQQQQPPAAQQATQSSASSTPAANPQKAATSSAQ